MVALRAQMAHTQIPPQKPMVLSSSSSCAFAPASAEANRIHTEAIRKRMQQKLKKTVFFALLVSFFRSRQPSRKKVPKMTSQSPSGTLPGTRLEGKIGLLVALGAFQGRFWTPKGGPNGTQNRSKIDLGAQGPPKSAQEPPGGPKRPPPEARIRGPPRPTSTRKSYTKILVKRSFQTALRKIHQRSLAQWPVLGAQPHWR